MTPEQLLIFGLGMVAGLAAQAFIDWVMKWFY
jgi:hypothetical protein